VVEQIVMVMEMAGHGDLLEYVKLRGALPDDKSKRLFAQLVSAVQYLHSLDIVHRYRHSIHLSSTTDKMLIYTTNSLYYFFLFSSVSLGVC